MEPDEIWLPVVGHEGHYEVSSHGRIRSLDRVTERRLPNGTTVSVRRRGVMLHPNIGSMGYPVVSLTYRKPTSVHVHVCEAFHGPRPSGHQVAHEDGNRANPRADNLRWATPKENNADKARHGTQQDMRGERGPGAKISDATARLIKASAGRVSQSALGKLYGIHQSTVSNIVTGRRWSHLEGAAQ